MEYKWIKTTPEVYRAVYAQHKDDLVCFESYTAMDSHGEQLKAQITGWGFADAEHPIIRSELRNFDEWEYYLLRTAYDDEQT